MYLDVKTLFTDIDGDTLVVDIGQDPSAITTGIKCMDLGDPLVYGKIATGGDLIKIIIQIVDAVTAEEDEEPTLSFRVVTSATEDLATPTVIVETGALGFATLVAGHTIVLAIPRVALTQRYLGVDVVVADYSTTGGTFVASVVWDDQNSDTAWTAATGFAAYADEEDGYL